MECVKLYDVLPDTNGIFTAMNTIKAFPWADVVTPAQMDTAYKQMYANKPISLTVQRTLNGASTLTENNITVLAYLLDGLFRDKWVNAYNLFLNSASAYLQGGAGTETIKETTTHDNATTDTGTTGTEGTQKGQISAFNSTDFADKDNTINSSTDTRDLAGTDKGTTTRDYIRTSFGDYYGDSYKKLLESLQSQILYDIIYVDANSVLALHIYD